jgi:hypothetical protein
MRCDHCHREITPGTERSAWINPLKRVGRVCVTCAILLLPTFTSGQTSPPQEPPPIPRSARRVSVDSGGDSMAGRRREGWNGDLLIGENRDTAPAGPARLPEKNTPEVPHPPHGEGSRELPIFVGIGASGRINVAITPIVSFSWEPPDQNHSAMDRFFLETDPHAKHTTLKVGPVHAPRPMPRARRSC